MKITIPASLDEAKASLNGIGALLTAKEWERAAIVWAFTRDGRGQPNRSTAILTMKEFAALRITGLSSENQVGLYRKAWQTAIDDGHAQPVKPGDEIELPDRKWPPFEPGEHVENRIFRSVVNDAAQFTEVFRGDPHLATVLADRVVENTATRIAVEAKLSVRVESFGGLREPQEPDYSKDFRVAVDRMLRCLDAMRAGRWEPDYLERTLAHFMASAWTEATGEEPTYSVIDEIQAFLVSAKAAQDA